MWGELWYNTTFQISTGTTTFKAVYGHPPPNVTHYIEGETKVEAVARELKDRDELADNLNTIFSMHRRK